MEKLLIFLTISLPLITAEVHGVTDQHGSLKLFVFGDSYADTGNWEKSNITSSRKVDDTAAAFRNLIVSPWKVPYGITFPGKPTGRFSDGRVSTDYIASFVGIRSPIPYNQWRKRSTKLLRYGMNFAYGGTGVFHTLVNEPNMTTQINFFQQLLQEKLYAKQDLDSSIALVSYGGNDYGTYLAYNGTQQGLPAFITSVVNQLALNLKRIQASGVKKIVITAMEPLGCLPFFTAVYSYQNCSETLNSLAMFHNQLLYQTVQKLNNESKESAFVILDLYSAFMSALKIQQNHPGSAKDKISLKPCCVGVSSEYSCGSVDEDGVKMYSVCKKPKSSFFWDMVHPSQNGWHAVSSALQSSLRQLF